MTDILPLIFISGLAGGIASLIANLAIQGKYTVPKLTALYEREKAFFLAKFEEEKAALPAQVVASVQEHLDIPAILADLKAEIPAAFAEVAPEIVNAMRTAGAKHMGNMTSGEQSMVKHALNGQGVDINALMNDPEIAKLAQQFMGGQAGGAMPGGMPGGMPMNPLFGLIQGFVPRKYMPYVKAFMASKGGGMSFGSAGGGNGGSGFNPGIGR